MYSILVVEDESSITPLLNETLALQDYQAVTVLNGEEAVQFALREMPHLILIDTMHASFDAYEIIRLLRKHPKSMHIPILLLSMNSSSAAVVRAFELGVDSYILKPFKTEELVAQVRRQLRRTQQSSLSPLTQLPGGVQLELAIDEKIKSIDPWSLLYLDLDNFKAFNDVYGFFAGNAMILLLSHICQRVVYEYGNTDDFVGHVGGDDFVIVTTPDRALLLCRHILTRYKQESAVLYREGDLKQGKISGLNREGRPYQFPLVSLSIGIVSNQLRGSYAGEGIGTLAAEAKRYAKMSSNNIFHISSQRGKLGQEASSLSPSSSSFTMASHLGRTLLHFAEKDVLAEL